MPPMLVTPAPTPSPWVMKSDMVVAGQPPVLSVALPPTPPPPPIDCA